VLVSGLVLRGKQIEKLPHDAASPSDGAGSQRVERTLLLDD
jgi:hypothetical protein